MGTQQVASSYHNERYSAPTQTQFWQQQQPPSQPPQQNHYNEGYTAVITDTSSQATRGQTIPVVTSNHGNSGLNTDHRPEIVHNVANDKPTPRANNIRAAIDTVLQLADILKGCEGDF